MRPIVFCLILAVAAVMLGGSFSAQSQSQQAASNTPRADLQITGRVVDGGGAGVGEAVVTLSGGFETAGSSIVTVPIQGGPRRTLTTSDGRFAFFGLPAGDYSLTAAKRGFLSGSHGQMRPLGQGQSFRLSESVKPQSISIVMWEFGSISGRLLDEAGEPLVGITVRALLREMEAGRPKFSMTPGDDTDDRGEFRFDMLVPGEYVVVVPFTQAVAPAAMFTAGGQLPATSSVSRFALGAAARYIGDWVWLSPRSSSLVLPATSTGRAMIYPTTFYPSTRSLTDAAVITLRSADARTGADIRMNPAPSSMVTGVVVGPAGPVAGQDVRLQPEYMGALSNDALLNVAQSVTDGAGRFVFFGVPAGRYTLNAASATDPGAGQVNSRVMWGSMPVNIGDADLVNLTLDVRSGFVVKGRVEFDGALPKATPEMMRRFGIRLEPTDPGIQHSPVAFRGAVDATGAFEVTNVPPGRYVVKFSASAEDRRAMAGWESVGARHDGRDVSTMPWDVRGDVEGLVLTLSDRAPRLSGRVRDSKGNPDSSACVLLFTIERELWIDSGLTNRRIRYVRASQDGSFVFPVVHAGSYHFLALPDAQCADWNDPRVMAEFAKSAQLVTMAPGERKQLDVVTRPRR